MLSGLCRYKLLQQKWLAYKSSRVSIEILTFKSSDANQGRAPRETTEKKGFQIGVDFIPEGDVDLVWMESATKFMPVSSKIRDRIRTTKSKNHGELPS